jgi:hypothetical protein
MKLYRTFKKVHFSDGPGGGGGGGGGSHIDASQLLNHRR